MGSCRVSLLGGFRVEVDGRPLPSSTWRHRRGADLVKLLALSPGHRLHLERAIDAFWPDLSPEAGSANLRKAVHYARRALGGDGGIRVEGGMVTLWPEGELEVDVNRSQAASEAATEEPGSATSAIDLLQGELLPEDAYEAWVQPHRDRLHRRFLDLLKLAGRWEEVVERDPLDEAAHRMLIRAAMDSGDRTAAMRLFERLRQLLTRELGVSPDPETVTLYEEVLAMEGPEPSTPEELARAHLATGLVAVHRMDLETAEREAIRARALAIDAELGRELGEASHLLGLVAMMQGRWHDRFREEFLEAVRGSASLSEFLFDSHLCMAEYNLYLPDGHGRMEGFAGELLELADEHGSDAGRALATLILGETELIRGRLEAAGADLARAADLHRAAGSRSGHALATERIAEAAIEARRWPEAEKLLEDSHGLAQGSRLVSHLLVRVHGAAVRAAGDHGTSLDAVRDAERDLAGVQVCGPCSMGFLTAAAIASARGKRAEQAHRYLERAESVSGMWPAGAWSSAVWEVRAEMRLAEGDARQAAALFREAAAGFSQAGHSLAETRARAAAEAAERV